MVSSSSDAYVGAKTAGRILGRGQASRAYKLGLLGAVRTLVEGDNPVLFSVADLIRVRDEDQTGNPA